MLQSFSGSQCTAPSAHGKLGAIPSRRAPRMATTPSLRLAVAALLLSSWALLGADASVHDYAGERFTADGDAFVLHGGSEGVYASAAAGAFIR